MEESEPHQQSDRAESWKSMTTVGVVSGDLGAVSRLLKQVPSDSEMAFVLLLLAEEDGDAVVAHLQQVTGMTVLPVNSNTSIQSSTCYVVPPDRELLLEGGAFHLGSSLQGAERCIDALFECLSGACEERTFGVVLSGAGVCGSQGIRQIKEQGGTVLVQTPVEAGQKDLPRSVLRAGDVDYVLPLSELVHKLLLQRPGYAPVLLDQPAYKIKQQEVQKEEVWFRALCEALPQIVWTAEPRGKLTYVNQRYVEYTGMAWKRESPWRWRRLIHPDDLRPTIDAWKTAVKEGRPHQIEHRIRRSDGVFQWHLTRALPLRDADRQVVRWFGSSTDIHGQKQTERELAVLNETLEERVAERTTLLQERTRQVQSLASALTLAEQRERQRISHVLHDDVQQLLYGLELTIRQIKRLVEPRGGELEDMLHQMEDIFDKTMNVTRNLVVELSPPILDSADFNTVLEWLAVHMASRHGLDVELDLEDCRVASQARRVLLFQLARELLMNVVKHAGVDEAVVRARQLSDRVFVEVIDGGVGFDLQTLEDHEPDAGFGLVSMRERLELLGGQLSVVSNAGDGAHVTIVLPTVGTEDPAGQT